MQDFIPSEEALENYVKLQNGEQSSGMYFYERTSHMQEFRARHNHAHKRSRIGQHTTRGQLE